MPGNYYHYMLNVYLGATNPLDQNQDWVDELSNVMALWKGLIFLHLVHLYPALWGYLVPRYVYKNEEKMTFPVPIQPKS